MLYLSSMLSTEVQCQGYPFWYYRLQKEARCRGWQRREAWNWAFSGGKSWWKNLWGNPALQAPLSLVPPPFRRSTQNPYIGGRGVGVGNWVVGIYNYSRSLFCTLSLFLQLTVKHLASSGIASVLPEWSAVWSADQERPTDDRWEGSREQEMVIWKARTTSDSKVKPSSIKT